MPLLRLENKHVMARKAAKLEEAPWKRKKDWLRLLLEAFSKGSIQKRPFFRIWSVSYIVVVAV